MTDRLIRGTIASVLAIGLVAGLGACNTMEGFGKDMAAAGRALTNSAERNKGGSASTTSGAAEFDQLRGVQLDGDRLDRFDDRRYPGQSDPAEVGSARSCRPRSARSR